MPCCTWHAVFRQESRLLVKQRQLWKLASGKCEPLPGLKDSGCHIFVISFRHILPCPWDHEDPQTYTSIWAIYYKSWTWLFRPCWAYFGKKSLTFHHQLGMTTNWHERSTKKLPTGDLIDLENKKHLPGQKLPPPPPPILEGINMWRLEPHLLGKDQKGVSYSL